MRYEELTNLYEMANLFPEDTGLPLVVWISEKGRAKHDVRVKVSLTPRKTNPRNTAIVSVRPVPEILKGILDPKDAKKILAWVALNAELIVEYWENKISSVGMAQRIKKLPDNKSKSEDDLV